MGFYVFNCVHKFDIFSLGHVKQASGKGHSPHSVVVCTVFAFVIVVADIKKLCLLFEVEKQKTIITARAIQDRNWPKLGKTRQLIKFQNIFAQKFSWKAAAANNDIGVK